MIRKVIEPFRISSPSLEGFNITHALIIAFLCHILFLLFFKTFAAYFLEPKRSLYEMEPPEKAIKFTLVEPQEIMKPRKSVKSEQPSEKEQLLSQEEKKEPAMTPKGEVPLPIKQEEQLVAQNIPVPPPPVPSQEKLQELQESKQQESTDQAKREEFLEELEKTKKESDQEEEKRIPITRKDLLGDFFVKPPETGSSHRFDGGLDLESGLHPNLTFETKDFDWTDYASAIYWAIWRSWHNRLYLTLNNFERWSLENSSPQIEGITGVRFVIEKNGNISEITLLFSSGVEPLDLSAVDALREVILPPLPSEFYKERERVTAKFIAETDIKSMKYYLPLLKYYGYF